MSTRTLVERIKLERKVIGLALIGEYNEKIVNDKNFYCYQFSDMKYRDIALVIKDLVANERPMNINEVRIELESIRTGNKYLPETWSNQFKDIGGFWVINSLIREITKEDISNKEKLLRRLNKLSKKDKY